MYNPAICMSATYLIFQRYPLDLDRIRYPESYVGRMRVGQELENLNWVSCPGQQPGVDAFHYPLCAASLPRTESVLHRKRQIVVQTFRLSRR